MDILNKYGKAKPGKYWKLPKNKKHLIDEYLSDENYIPMIKYDGYWSRILIGDDKVIIQSRGISKVTNDYGRYEDKVPHIVEELMRTFPSGTVLLGELHYPKLSKTISDVGTILRCKAPKACERQALDENKLHLSLFDILAIEEIELAENPFSQRISTLNQSIQPKNKYVHVAEQGKPGEGSDLLESVWSNGGEGIILLKKGLPYNSGGAKAWHSIKVKREMPEVEAPIIEILEPEMLYKGKELDSWSYWGIFKEGDTKPVSIFHTPNGKGELADTYEKTKDLTLKPISKFYYNGWKKGLTVDYNGKKVKMSSGVTEEDGEFLATEEAQELVKAGKLFAVFTGMELTEDSVRHPSLVRLRDDI